MEKLTVPVAKLLVNPKNPRFEPVTSQPEAIDLMLKEAGKSIIRLGNDIAKRGLNPSKKLMVVRHGNNFLALEGNRRVVALKLLDNPSLANGKVADDFNTLKKDYGAHVPTEVECVVFPDQESASHWISLEHTGRNQGVGVLSWNNVQRQRFIAQYAGKKLARSVQLFDFADENSIDRTKVDSTTLDRVVATPEVRKEIGIEFPEGVLSLSKSKAQVIKNLRRVLAEMSQKEFKVGNVYTQKQRKEWIKGVLGNDEKSKPDQPAEPTPKGPISKKDALEGDWVNGRLYVAYSKNNRVKAMLKELKDIHPTQKPNVCGTSLRVLLELAVYTFLKDKSGISAIIVEEKARLVTENKKRAADGKPPREWKTNWTPEFQKMLTYLSKEESLIPDPQDRSALSTFIDKTGGTPFLAELNSFIHNPSYEPTASDVLNIWSKLGKLIFRNILPQI